MTQEEKDRLAYQISVMQAFAKGKEIERFYDGKWEDSFIPLWNWAALDYRIKPEPPKPQYRPFESAEEVMDAIKKHGCWVKDLDDLYYNIGRVGIDLINYFDGEYENFHDAFSNNVFLDGTPFGKLIEE